MVYAYILISLKDGTHYYGCSSDLKSRLNYHNSGKVTYTKGHRPWRIHYYEAFQTRKMAMSREKFFKSIEGYKWLKENDII